ncbi:MAG: sugar phosphate isomerase/epimerase family protein [bacterium]
MMRLAVQEGLFKADFRTFLEKVKGWGLSEVELWGEGLRDRFDSVKKALRETGIGACSICPGANGIRGSLLAGGEQSAVAAADVEGFLAMAAELGGAALILVPEFRAERFPSLGPDDSRFRTNRDAFIERLEPLGEKARRLGARILLEPLNRYETGFIFTAGQAAAVCDALDTPGVRLMLDLFHANIEEDDVPETIRRCAGWLSHVHLADSNRLLPGKGHLDFGGIFTALREINYSGALCVECAVSAFSDAGVAASFDFLRKAAAAL